MYFVQMFVNFKSRLVNFLFCSLSLCLQWLQFFLQVGSHFLKIRSCFINHFFHLLYNHQFRLNLCSRYLFQWYISYSKGSRVLQNVWKISLCFVQYCWISYNFRCKIWYSIKGMMLWFLDAFGRYVVLYNQNKVLRHNQVNRMSMVSTVGEHHTHHIWLLNAT